MKKLGGMVLIALTVAIALLNSDQAAAAQDGIAAEMAARAERFVSAGSSDGISVAVLECGVSTYVARGVSDVATRRPVTPDTRFDIGSVSKTLTSLLLARATVTGRVRLNDDVRRYLPAGYTNLAWSDGTPITLGQLADTTSGLPDFLPDPAPIAKVPPDQQVATASAMLGAYSNDDFLADLRRVNLRSKPGTEAKHSNVAAQLLGYVMSRVYRAPFGTALYRYVERPAGMSDGTAAASLAVQAVGYDDQHGVMPPYTGESIMPAGGLRYTARDLARLLRLQLSRHDEAVLLSQRVRYTGDPNHRVAFTWVVSEPVPGITKYRMSGGTFGGSSYVEFYPTLGYGVMLAANRAGANTQDALQDIAEKSFEARRGALGRCSAR